MKWRQKWGRRDLEEESRKKGEKGAEVPPQTRHKSKGAVKTQHLRALCFQLSRRGAKTALSRREGESLMSLDVLIAPLITCCCARVTLKSQINYRVNINHAALGWRAGKSFKGRRERRGRKIKKKGFTHTARQAGQPQKCPSPFDQEFPQYMSEPLGKY